MSSLTSLRNGLAALLFVVSLAATARAQFEDLIAKVPPSANALVMVNVDALRQSPVAQREGWHDSGPDDTGMAALEHPVVAPADAQRLVLAALVHPRSGESLWEVGVVELRREPNLQAIARQEGGYVESIAGAPAAWSPRDAYFIQLAPRTLGMMYPGIRQAAARWVAGGLGPTHSEYLLGAARYVTAGTEIILAIDLRDAVSAEAARRRLEGAQSLAGADLDVVSELVASIQGVTLGVQAGERLTGSIKVDFALDAAPLADVAKPLLLEALGQRGMMLDEFESWTARVEGTVVRLDGELTTSGLRRIMSIIELPSPTLAPADTTAAHPLEPAEVSPSVVQAASLEHFHAVTALFDDLMSDRRRSQVATIGQFAVWFDRYARRIDRLPVLNVDKDLLAYSAEVAERLRVLAGTVRGIGIESSAAEKQIHGYYGDYGRRYEAGERRAASAPILAEGATSARDQIAQIENLTADVRRQMTERYGVEF